MCRPREILEASLKPVETDKLYGVMYQGIVMKNEMIFAYPPKTMNFLGEGGCKRCREDGRDSDIRLHVVFQPRGHMSFNHYLPPPYKGEIRPWDVSPPLRFLSKELQNEARSRVKGLIVEYADYQPHLLGCSPDYEKEIKSLKVKTKMAPKNIADVRFQWPAE